MFVTQVTYAECSETRSIFYESPDAIFVQAPLLDRLLSNPFERIFYVSYICLLIPLGSTLFPRGCAVAIALRGLIGLGGVEAAPADATRL